MSKHATTPPSFATLVQAYFAEYLPQQRALSPQTIAAYRDAFEGRYKSDVSTFGGHAYDLHRHETYGIGLTLYGVQQFHYRGSLRASRARQVRCTT